MIVKGHSCLHFVLLGACFHCIFNASFTPILHERPVTFCLFILDYRVRACHFTLLSSPFGVHLHRHSTYCVALRVHSLLWDQTSISLALVILVRRCMIFLVVANFFTHAWFLSSINPFSALREEQRCVNWIPILPFIVVIVQFFRSLA